MSIVPFSTTNPPQQRRVDGFVHLHGLGVKCLCQPYPKTLALVLRQKRRATHVDADASAILVDEASRTSR